MYILGYEAKISLTVKCNAKCITCPVHLKQREASKNVGEYMPFEIFKEIFNKLVESPLINRIMINNTGDCYIIPNHIEYLKYIEEKKGNKFVGLTTNGGVLDYIPAIDVLVISFNASNRESYKKIVGLDFDIVYNNIKKMAKDFEKCKWVEIHHLVFEDNAGDEKEFFELFKDLPCALRISYKYDCIDGKDKTLPQCANYEKTVCDYLYKLSILPNGQIISCAHDFDFKTNWGNILIESVEELLTKEQRLNRIKEQQKGVFDELCVFCNYNNMNNHIYYIK